MSYLEIQLLSGVSGGYISAGVQYYDRQTKKKEWTNYSAVVFAKPGAQADYYRSVLVEGSIVEITGENIRVDVYHGQNGQSITLELLNAKIGFADSGNGPQQQSSNQQNTPVYDDSIPF
ncbi:hypothetical protein MHI67_26230 [Escherichia coli]|nr:hypothetical protein [Escherichia coli]